MYKPPHLRKEEERKQISQPPLQLRKEEKNKKKITSLETCPKCFVHGQSLQCECKAKERLCTKCRTKYGLCPLHSNVIVHAIGFHSSSFGKECLCKKQFLAVLSSTSALAVK